MLLKNGRKPDFGFAGRTISRYIRHVLLALNVLFVIGCTAFVVSEIDSSGESRVYAVDTSSEGSGRAQQFQTGLMAVMNGVENMEQYDTVFLGYPSWWADCPMAVLSFLEE